MLSPLYINKLKELKKKKMDYTQKYKETSIIYDKLSSTKWKTFRTEGECITLSFFF